MLFGFLVMVEGKIRVSAFRLASVSNTLTPTTMAATYFNFPKLRKIILENLTIDYIEPTNDFIFRGNVFALFMCARHFLC
jgi:hypothetical protein